MRSVRLDISVTADDAILWRDNMLYLLDQRLLPHEEVFIECSNAEDTAKAIRAMVVRGAPAIGITAAYGVALAVRQHYAEAPGHWRERVEQGMEVLARSRPTAVNLFWALERCRKELRRLEGADPFPRMLALAQALHASDRAMNRRMGEFGAALIEGPTGVITHCNAGGLATGGHGTALGVIRTAHAQGRVTEVFADETRPWLQGARLTAWELVQEEIPVQLMADGAACARMAEGGIGWVIVGSDRIAANGDVANKIGTFALAVAARHHGVRFMVAAPTSTIDPDTASGADIPIETRADEEILSCAGRPIAAAGAGAWNPVFDVTPAGLIDVIVTEKGVIPNPDAEKIADHLSD